MEVNAGSRRRFYAFVGNPWRGMHSTIIVPPESVFYGYRAGNYVRMLLRRELQSRRDYGVSNWLDKN